MDGPEVHADLELNDSELCYVCYEPSSQKSPCDCQKAIHPKCLYSMQKQMPHEHCTICKTPLKFESVSFPEAFEPIDIILHTRPPKKSPVAECTMFFIILFFWYVLTGYTGKLVMMMCKHKFSVETFFEFWSGWHITGAALVSFLAGLYAANRK